jgi:predicted Zn-dependent protease
MSHAPKSLYRRNAEYLSRDDAKALADRVLGFAKADETRVNINSGWNGNTRFAGNEITTSGGITDTTVTVTSTIGRRRASAETNVLDDASLKRTVEFAESLARLSPENPEFIPELGPQDYAQVNGFFEATANLDPEVRARATKQAIDAAESAGRSVGNIFVAGFLQANATARVVATSRGLFAYHRDTDVGLGITARTPDATGSGWANRGARDWGVIDAAALGRVAAEKAVASQKPTAIEPGFYNVVLEPAAVGDIMGASWARSMRAPTTKGAARSASPVAAPRSARRSPTRASPCTPIPPTPNSSRAVRARRDTGASRDLHRERHPEGVLVRSLLGAEAGQDAHGWWWRRAAVEEAAVA